MTAEQWRITLRIYSTAREISLNERLTFINSASADPEVVQEVLNLLNASVDTGANVAVHAPPRNRTGTRIGRYEVGKLLGRGGMGEVYAAHDTELDRPIALKFLISDLTDDRSGIRRFVHEAKAVSALNHPNILTVYEVVYAESGPAIAMELVEGSPFGEFRGAPLSSGRVMDLGRQITSALAAAHEKGIMHRDIKPENLMLRKDGLVKVLDFGLARAFALQETEKEETTGFEIVAGTPPYMSPEQLRGDSLTGASDVFSLGIVFYELATGKHPFEAKYAWERAHAIHSREPIPPSSVNAAIPSGLDALIQTMLNKDPQARPSARDLARLFEAGLRSAENVLPESHATGMGRTGTAPDEHPQQKTQRTNSVTPKTVVAVTSLLVLIGLVIYAWNSGENVRPDAPLNVVPLTTFAGYKDYAAFSLDGRHIAFSWNGGKKDTPERQIYVMPVSGNDPTRLTSGGQDDTWPAWSPDGRNIAFVRRLSGSESAIYVVSSNGGAERKLADGGDGVSWSQDGKTLALTRPSAPNVSGGLFLLSLTSGKQHDLDAPQNATDSLPVFSPDGHWIAFMRKRSERDLFVIPTGGGAARQLTFDANPKLGLTWTADSREIVYSTEREYGGAGLWRIGISGGVPRRVASTLDFAGNPNISRQGERLAYTESWIDSNIYQSDGPGLDSSGVPGQFGAPEKIISSSREDHSPSFSPDGKRITFVSNRTGHSEIWTSDHDGHEIRLTHFDSFSGTPRWSPDGQWIVFDALTGGNTDIWVVAAQGGAPHRLTTEPAPDTTPSWSPDGTWIYFTSHRSGIPQVWKMKPDGSAATQLTRDGGREPQPSVDGRVIYYTKRVGPASIWTISADGGKELPLSGMQEFNKIARSWGVLKKGIYFLSADPDGRVATVDFFSFTSRQVVPLRKWQGRTMWTVPAVAISADGRHLLTVQIDQQVNDLMMIEPFR